MQTSRASTRRAALAAFLLFAAALLVVGPAEASRTTTNTRSSLPSISAPNLAPSSSRELASLELSLLEPVEPADSASISSRFGFAEDLSLLDVEARPCGFELFGGVETRRCALTYARNNPLKYVDPDGRSWKIPASLTGNYDRNFALRATVYSTLMSAGPAGEGAAFAADSVLKLALPSSNEEVLENFETALMGMAAGVNLPTGEFSIIKWQGFPEGVAKPEGPFRVLAGEEYQVARSTANSTNRGLHSANPSLAGKQIHEIQPVKLNGSPTSGANKVALPPREHAKVTTWFNRFLRDMKEFLDGK